jgi:hypothetical protein
MTAVLLVALLVGAQPAVVPPACPDGRAEAGDVGIRGVRCAGPAASCAINVRSPEDGVVRHTFAVEPVVTAVAPSTRDLRLGDTIVAIEGILITTAAGGERFAGLPIGKAVRLLIRRDESLRDLEVVTTPGCGLSSLEVSR